MQQAPERTILDQDALTLLKCPSEPCQSLQPYRLIDVEGRHLRFHHKFVGARHDLHDSFAVADHAVHGMHGKLMNGPRLRRAQVDALTVRRQ